MKPRKDHRMHQIIPMVEWLWFYIWCKHYIFEIKGKGDENEG